MAAFKRGQAIGRVPRRHIVIVHGVRDEREVNFPNISWPEPLPSDGRSIRATAAFLKRSGVVILNQANQVYCQSDAEVCNEDVS